ncbi:unnamed protein product [Caenorhabditis bovis]|uniref:Aquaporin n=1 Tax=Caenorhabditis bovis TaxID=2654633 RepID=A0A8S1ER57_9PELO|nr:unnamed protein product [Caenorhabditis bovis]
MGIESITDALQGSYFLPLYSALAYYTFVFALGEIARILVSKYAPKSGNTRLFLIEMIGTVQMCTCVYENGIIVKYYGLNAFFIVVGLLLTAGSVFNRGALGNCAPVFEDFYFNKISSTKLLALISAQLIGATFASRLAYAIWTFTSNLSTVHMENALNTECILNYHQPAGTVIAFEIAGAFAIRGIISFLAQSSALRRTIPFVISLYLALALYIIGVPGLNPIVATSRLYGCQGIDNNSFVLLYWVCPTVGWLMGAHIFRNDKPVKQSKSTKKASKKN